MTYKELLDELEQLDDDQLTDTCMAQVDGEMYSISSLNIQEGEDLLKDGAPYISVE